MSVTISNSGPESHTQSDGYYLLHVVSVFFFGNRNVLVHWKRRKVINVTSADVSSAEAASPYAGFGSDGRWESKPTCPGSLSAGLSELPLHARARRRRHTHTHRVCFKNTLKHSLIERSLSKKNSQSPKLPPSGRFSESSSWTWIAAGSSFS